MDKIKRKMYTCLHCQRNGAVYMQERYRTVTHVQKHHMALNQVPFYCTLCMFRCSTRDALEKHLTHYKRHAALAETMGYDPVPRRHLIQNPNPKQVVDGVDIRLSTNDDLACRNPFRLDDPSDNFEDPFSLSLTHQTPPAEQLQASLQSINFSVTPEQLTNLMSPAAPSVNHQPQQQYDPFDHLLNTPPQSRWIPSSKSVVEDIATDLLPDEQWYDLLFYPAEAKTETMQTDQAKDAAPPQVQVPTVELGPAVEAMVQLEKKVTAGFSSLVSMVESNTTAISNLEKTLGTHLEQITKSFDRLAGRKLQPRTKDDHYRMPVKRPRLDENEGKTDPP